MSASTETSNLPSAETCMQILFQGRSVNAIFDSVDLPAADRETLSIYLRRHVAALHNVPPNKENIAAIKRSYAELQEGVAMRERDWKRVKEENAMKVHRLRAKIRILADTHTALVKSIVGDE